MVRRLVFSKPIATELKRCPQDTNVFNLSATKMIPDDSREVENEKSADSSVHNFSNNTKTEPSERIHLLCLFHSNVWRLPGRTFSLQNKTFRSHRRTCLIMKPTVGPTVATEICFKSNEGGYVRNDAVVHQPPAALCPSVSQAVAPARPGPPTAG